MAAWKAMLSGSLCVRRLSSTGVRSAPPPNQDLMVTTKRVFMCTAGTCGLCGCAISEMPEAQKRGSSAAPGISLRNSGANSPCTVEQCTPTFSNTRPRISDITPPPPGCAGMVGALPWRAHETAGRRCRQAARSRAGRLPPPQGRADIVAQRLEPGARAGLAGFETHAVDAVIGTESLANCASRPSAAAPRRPPARRPSRH